MTDDELLAQIEQEVAASEGRYPLATRATVRDAEARLLTPDVEALRSVLASALPTFGCWVLGENELRFDFTRVRAPLRPVDEEVSDPLEPTWRSLLVIGGQDYADGGGAQPLIALHAERGEVLGFDPERDDPVFFYSTSAACFVRMFELFDAVLRRGAIPLAELDVRAAEIDPDGYARSDWKLLAGHVMATATDDSGALTPPLISSAKAR